MLQHVIGIFREEEADIGPLRDGSLKRLRVRLPVDL
jgi:hypothetical protein